jgi:hypothetical protein
LSTPAGRHDPPLIFAALSRRGVEHMTVGGLAVGFWANPRATKDTDIIVPTDDPVNDKRLREALGELDAEPLPLEAPGAPALGIHWELEANVERWVTAGGVLDVMREVKGARPYRQMRERAEPTTVFGAATVMVGREDLIAMKLAAGRGQDVVDLEALLDRRNHEAQRVAQRALDRALLVVAGEPVELGEPVDPCEREVDAIRRVLATVGVRPFNTALARRSRELRDAPDEKVSELAGHSLLTVPDDLEQTAAFVADAARQMEAAEDSEFALVDDRDRAPLRRRRERTEITGRLQEATERVEQLRAAAERGVEQLRTGVAEIEAWWSQTGERGADVIAGRRELYRRQRDHTAQRVRDVPEHPAEYVTEAIGSRPVDAHAHKRWDAAARSIEAYVAQHRGEREPPLTPPELADRAARGAWERMERAIRAAGIEPPSLGQERDSGLELDR